MEELQRVRVCGSCAHNTTNRFTGSVLRSFKCDIDMRWCAYDETCKMHVYDGELPHPAVETATITKQKEKKSEVIDLGGIPDSIRGDIPNAPAQERSP